MRDRGSDMKRRRDTMKHDFLLADDASGFGELISGYILVDFKENLYLALSPPLILTYDAYLKTIVIIISLFFP